MAEPDLRLIEEDGKGVTRFGDVLSAVLQDANLTQFELATQVDYSQPAISRVENGARNLTPKLAGKLSDVLGSTKDRWLSLYDKTKTGSPRSVDYYKSFLFGSATEPDMPGVRIRRMQSDDLLRFFDNSTGEMMFRGIKEPCEIASFSRDRVQPTSYDTVAGGFVDPKDDKKTIEITDTLTIPSFECRLVIVKEHITLPSWLEAEIHPASNIAMKGLIVSHGPIIDPGWDGYLKVSVFNATGQDQHISVNEPFLTLRFWMQDAL